MALSSELISQFVKATNSSKKENNETTVYATVVYNGKPYVKLDGSDLLTPISTTADVKDGERVTVMIKNHTATVTGNISSPSARTDDVKEIGSKISEFEIVMAYKVTTEDLEAVNATIESLRAKVANFTDIEAVTAEINNLQAKFANLEYVSATDVDAINADIENLQASFATITDLTTEDLEALNAEIANLRGYTADFTYVSADVLEAIKANIRELDAKKLSAESAELKYANIDFANIGEAAIKAFYAKSGVIQDVVISDGQVTGKLVGVTIKGDLIEGGTVVADKLVIQGEDGLYYKLNTNGETVSSEQTDYNSLNGSIITAQSITAEKIAVDDLVAFDATIGGFNITSDAIYSGVKSSATNTTRGIYLDNDGQLSVGDANNFIRYYREQNTYKIEWDGVTTDITPINTYYYKVSDILPDNIDDLIGQTVVLSPGETSDDVSFTIDQDNLVEHATNFYAIIYNSMPIAVICMEDVTVGDVAYDSGVYFISCTDSESNYIVTKSIVIPKFLYKLEISSASIDDVRNEINESSISIRTDVEGLILEALKSCVKTAYYDEESEDDRANGFDTFYESVKTQLEILAGELSLRFTTDEADELKSSNESMQSQLDTITKYFTFDVNGLTIGQTDSKYKVVIDNDRYSMQVNGIEIMWIANGEVHTPKLTVLEKLQLLGLQFELDDNFNLNCEWIGIPLTITAQPNSVSYSDPGTYEVTFIIGATGIGLEYYWQEYSTTDSTWSNIADANEASYTVTIECSSDDTKFYKYYRCVVTDSDGNEIASDTAQFLYDP